MEEEKRLPIGAISCIPAEEGMCKVWWLATIKHRTYTVECKIPVEDVPGRNLREKELNLEEIMRDSEVVI